MAACPKCGAKVRKEKLRRHLSTVHGGAPRAAKGPRAADAKGSRPSTVKFPLKAVVALAVVAALVLVGYWYLTQPGSGPSGSNPSAGSVAVIETNYGTIKIALDKTRAPRTAGNFIALANAGKYNGNSFHRVAANFVIQGGAVSGAANVAWESTGLKNVAYSIAMARSGSANDSASKDTATSQFFINLKDNPSLDTYDPATRVGFTYAYVVFGHVTEGQSVVQTIGALPTNPAGDGQPTSPVTILRVTIQ